MIAGLERAVMPRLAIPMVPIIQEGECPHALFDALMKYHCNSAIKNLWSAATKLNKTFSVA
jgi:hypothetical protein